MKKNVQFWVLLIASVFSFVCLQAQTNSNPFGFESGATGTWVPNSANGSYAINSTAPYVRTGSYSTLFSTVSTSSNQYWYNNLPYGASASGTYVHFIYWAITSDPGTVQVDASMRYGSSAPPSGAGSTSNGSAFTLNTSTWTRVYHTAGNSNNRWYFPSPRRTNGVATSFYMDDAIIYTSNSSTIDLTKPLTPNGGTGLTGTPSGSTVNLSWTSNTDAGTGVQNTLILRTSNTAAAAPVLLDQAQYSTTGGANGPNVVGTDWTIISTTTGATATTYSDLSVANGNYKYAVVLRDLAYNYSVAVVSAPITVSACSPPSITGQPSNTSGNPGGSFGFSITTSGLSGAATFEWQYSANGSTGWGNVANGTPAGFTYGGAATNSLSITTTGASPTGVYYYRCIVTDPTNNPGCPATSASATLSLNPNLPVLVSMNPTSKTAGDPGFTLTVTGTDFAANSVVRWNGVALTTTYVSATQLDATVPAGNVATAGTANIDVSTPSVGTSATVLTFTINAIPTGLICPAAGSVFTIDPGLPYVLGGTNFQNFTQAINDLNSCSPLNKDVIFNVLSGANFTENAPAITVNTNGHTVIFQKSGVAHATITAGTGVNAIDAVINITGAQSSRITFDGIDIQNNTGDATQKAEFGYRMSGGGTNVVLTNCVVSGMNATGSSSSYGIYAASSSNLTISYCTINNITSSNTSTSYAANGIFLTGVSGTTTINGNNIGFIYQINTSSSGQVRAVTVTPNNGATVNFYNNFVHSISNSAASSGSLRTLGVLLAMPAAGANVTANVYFNTIYLSGTFNTDLACLNVTGTQVNLNLQNNIFKYDGTNTANDAYCVYISGNPISSLASCDYNIYDMRAPFGSAYFTGYYNGSDRSLLVSWQTATGLDLNSKQFSAYLKSTSDLHLATVPDANYDAISLGAPYDYDYDLEVRGTGAPGSGTGPIIGADEVSRTIAALVVTPVHPGEACVAQSTPDIIVGRFRLNAYIDEPQLTQLKLKFSGSYATGTTDFYNFRILYNTTNDLSTATSIGTLPSGGAAPASGSTVTVTVTTTFLNNADDHYLFIVCDAQSGVLAGTQIKIEEGSVNDFIFSGPVTKFGSDPLPAGNYQTICDYFYNSGTTAAAIAGGYPTTADITDVNAWRSDITGAGIPPSNFASNNTVFNIINNNTATFVGASLTISGTNSFLQIGTGAAVHALTIPVGKTLTATVDMRNSSTLTLQNAIPAPSPITFRTLSNISTVVFAGSAGNNQTVPPANYNNLTLASTGGTLTLNSTGKIGVARTFTNSLSGTTLVTTGSNVDFNGSIIAQSIPTFAFDTLTVSNTISVTTADISASGAVYIKKGTFTIPAPNTVTLLNGIDSFSVWAGATMNVNGKIINQNIGSLFGPPANRGTQNFNSGSVFDLQSAPANGGGIADIPLTTLWHSNSTLLISGIVGPAGSADYTGLSGNYQTFGKVIIDVPNLTGKLLLTNNTSGGFSASKLIVLNTGASNAAKSGLVQISREGTQKGVLVGEYYQGSGVVVISENSSSETEHRSMNVTGNFTVVDSPAVAFPSVFKVVSRANGGGVNYGGYLRVGGNFYMGAGTFLTKTPDNSGTTTANIVFNGTTGNQTMTMLGTITGNHNLEINKTTNQQLQLKTDFTAYDLRLTVGRLIIEAANTLTLNGQVLYGFYPAYAGVDPSPFFLRYQNQYYNTTGNTGTGTISGTSTSNLVVNNTNAGMLRFTTDNLAGATAAHILGNLTLGNAATASIAATHFNGTTSNALNIAGLLTLGSGNATLTTNNRLNLLSTATSTASVAAVPSGSAISGKVCVERYIPNARRWRLLSSDMFSNTDLTIKQAWQDSVNNTTFVGPWGTINQVKRSGYATHITRGNNNSLGGYDNSPWLPSIRALVPNANAALIWGSGVNNNIASTDNSTGDGQFNYRPGYMLFVRGDRTVHLPSATGAADNVTTLRPVGDLRIGNYSVTGDATSFIVVGNPYASAVNYVNVLSHSTLALRDHYVLDPNAGGVGGTGAFVLMQWQSGPGNFRNTFTNTTADGILQSGQAILLKSSGNINFTEADKIASHSTAFFRPSGIEGISENFRGVLSVIDPGGALGQCDVNELEFDNAYKNEVDFSEDIEKLHNFSENFAIYHRPLDQYLIVERRKPQSVSDTIFFRIYGMKQKSYAFDFTTTNMDHPNMVAYLEDLHLKTKTIVNLNGTTRYNFTIDATAASRNADRFRIVFAEVESGPLPVTFTSVSAAQKEDDVDVQWNVSNQINIKEYQVQVSTDGRSFVTKATVTATGGNGASLTYNWLDEHPAIGDNFYRIVSVDQNGKTQYTQIVKVNIGNLPQGMLVYPNPVRDGNIGLKMNNMPEGVYRVRLTNAAGQLMLSTSINHAGGSSIKTIRMKESAAKGVYNLEVIGSDKSTTILKVINQ